MSGIGTNWEADMAQRSLRTRLSLNIALVALLTVAIISVSSNVFINRRFEDYIAQQRQQRVEEILSSLVREYDAETGTWNLEFLHGMGMYALYSGYIVKVYDLQGEMLWDAEVCDMRACMQVMDDISLQMRERYPGSAEGFDGNGGFTAKISDLTLDGRKIGKASVGYFSPYFLDENEFHFLGALNAVLVGSSVFSLVLAVVVGCFLAKNMSSPIRKTAQVAKQMSEGDYVVRIQEKTSVEELDELMSSVNHLARSLNEQENLRKQITADVACELSTPLAAVGAHIEAMMKGIQTPTRERLSNCRQEIERIGELVRGLETLAMQRSRLHPT
jgi:HAMP domain-containing protein